MKLCLQCVQCHLDLGDPGYSEMTPGWPGHFECYKGHFNKRSGSCFGTEEAWKLIQQAQTCKDFTPAGWAKAEKAR